MVVATPVPVLVLCLLLLLAREVHDFVWDAEIFDLFIGTISIPDFMRTEMGFWNAGQYIGLHPICRVFLVVFVVLVLAHALVADALAIVDILTLFPLT